MQEYTHSSKSQNDKIVTRKYFEFREKSCGIGLSLIFTCPALKI
jgi:hypothetical protein